MKSQAIIIAAQSHQECYCGYAYQGHGETACEQQKT